MAFTTTDITNIEEAIRQIVLGKRTVSLAMGDKSITYTNSDLKELYALLDKVKSEVSQSSGTTVTRTYAGQGGRA